MDTLQLLINTVTCISYTAYFLVIIWLYTRTRLLSVLLFLIHAAISRLVIVLALFNLSIPVYFMNRGYSTTSVETNYVLYSIITELTGSFLFAWMIINLVHRARVGSQSNKTNTKN